MSKPRRLGTSALLALALVGTFAPAAQAEPSGIYGTVFSDRGNDGVFDAGDGDTGISGVTILSR